MRVICLAVLMLWVSSAAAHKPSDSYLALQVEADRVVGQWDIALRDLDYAVGLDGNGDRAITWGELRSRRDQVVAYAFSHLQLRASDLPCSFEPGDLLVDRHTDGMYAVVRFAARCTKPIDALSIHYSLLFDLDAQHRGLWRLQHGEVTQTGVLATDRREQAITLTKPRTLLEQTLEYSGEGVWHIWTGYDHVLFLLSLLLPAVFVRASGRWLPVDRFAVAFWDVLKIVTAFTVAHSITLSLAVFKVVVLPSRWVESIIALSVIGAALNNLAPLIGARRWVVAFAFGLIHGLGFANVLLDLGLPRASLATALVAFNGGVEIGQLAIVALFLPVGYLLRSTGFYYWVVFRLGSIGIALCAGLWLFERAFDWRPF